MGAEYIILIFAVIIVIIYFYYNSQPVKVIQEPDKITLAKPKKSGIDVDKLFHSENLPNQIENNEQYLVNPSDKETYYKMLREKHKQFGKAMCDYTKHQLDSDTIIKTDITIDPFKNDGAALRGKAIKDIYDAMTLGPQFKKKHIKYQTDTQTIYENESELNGAMLKGSILCGYSTDGSNYKSAMFGNDF